MASCSTNVPNNETFFIVDKKLISLLGRFKKVNIISTFPEVVEGLRIYIVEKKLFDPMSPVNIRCHDDELSTVFGVEDFTIYDVRKLLRKHVFPILFANNLSADIMQGSSKDSIPCKRKAEEDENEERKRSCIESQGSSYLHTPPPSSDEEKNSDVDESIQECEANDNDSFVYESSDEETYAIEYEIQSEIEEHPKVCLTDTESEADLRTVNMYCKSDSDHEGYADKSGDEDVLSTPLDESDKWTCQNCNSINDCIMQYCRKCCSLKSGKVLPRRTERVPTKRKFRKRIAKKPLGFPEEEFSSSPSSFSSSSSEETSCYNSPVEFQEHSTTFVKLVNNLFSDSFNSKESPTSSVEFPSCSRLSNYSDASSSSELSTVSSNSPTECISSEQLNTISSVTSDFLNKPSTSSTKLLNYGKSSNYLLEEISSSSDSSPRDIVGRTDLSLSDSCLEFPSASTCNGTEDNVTTPILTTATKYDPDVTVCVICCINSANASMIHGKYAHQITCYPCAKKLKRANKRCPACHHKIDRVVHQIPVF